MLENDYYTYRITWSMEDNEYVGLCSEFPGLSWLAADQDSALLGIKKLVADVVTDMRANNEVVPEPLATKQFSGRFMVRIPPELHRKLAMDASDYGISLNRLVSDKLNRAP